MINDIQDLLATPAAAVRDLASRISMGNEHEASDGANLSRDSANQEEKEASAGENLGERLPGIAASEGGLSEDLDLEVINQRMENVSMASQD